VGYVALQPVRASELISADQAEFDRDAGDYQAELHQLQIKYAHARHDLLERQLDKLLDQRALEQAATAEHTTPQALLATVRPEPISDADVSSFYQSNQDRISQPLEQVAPQIRRYLVTQRRETATRQFYGQLRARFDIRSQLPPFRVAVQAAGPVRGATSAPVTIVEFGDFQCPYCKQAEATLQTLLARHPGQLQLVFRNYPLSRIHPDADGAAAAAVCANRQNKFWEMHDALYADQKALGSSGLAATAQRLGLNMGQFTSCLTDTATRAALATDERAAQDLGILGTPYFFINGRPVDGSVPLEQFERIVADELHPDTHTPATGL
jgi:protein-disulfide isomerase